MLYFNQMFQKGKKIAARACKLSSLVSHYKIQGYNPGKNIHHLLILDTNSTSLHMFKKFYINVDFQSSSLLFDNWAKLHKYDLQLIHTA